jgi:hypothetical protein
VADQVDWEHEVEGDGDETELRWSTARGRLPKGGGRVRRGRLRNDGRRERRGGAESDREVSTDDEAEDGQSDEDAAGSGEA